MALTIMLIVRAAVRLLRSPTFVPALAARIAAAMPADGVPALRTTALSIDAAPTAPAAHRPGWRTMTVRLNAPLADTVDAAALSITLLRAVAGLTGVEPLDEPSAHRLPEAQLPAHDPGADLRLSFLTPLEWPASPDGAGPVAQDFLALVAARHQKVFGHAPVWPDDSSSLHLLAHFTRDAVAARSQAAADAVAVPGQPQRVIGPVFLRGASPALVAALHRLAPAYLPGAVRGLRVEWRGRFVLAWQRTPWLDRALAQERRIVAVAGLALARDDIDPVLAPGGSVARSSELARLVAARCRPGGDAPPAPAAPPTPNAAFVLHRAGHAPRIVERLATPELVLEQYLLQTLQPAFERLLLPCSYGYRPGRGREAAVSELRAALRQGHVHVLRTDIAQCFPSIDHDHLLALLDRALPRSDMRLRQLLAERIRQPYVLDGLSYVRTRGLAQGAPLSPLLVNLCLTGLDRCLDPPRWRYLRFADDIVVGARTRPDAEEALATLARAAAGLGLALSPAKTRVVHLREGFEFLGETFSPATLDPDGPATAAQRKPLLVTEDFLQIGVNGEALEARRRGAIAGTWPLRRLSGLLLLARCNISTAVLERCSTHEIPIAVSLRSGKQIAVLVPNQRRAHDALHRHALWHDALSPEARLALAQAVVHAKLVNGAALVRQREPSSPLLGVIAEARRSAARATTTDALRGHEGAVARRMFRWLQEQVVSPQRDAFASRRRARGGPDRFNAALNLGYYLLYTRLNAMLRLRGLNPYLGWLHDGVDEDYETLVYDLMEPFRCFVDRMLLRQINRQALQPRHFEQRDGQWRLTRSALRDFGEAFERTLGEAVGRHRLRDLLWLQVRAVDDLVGGRGAAWMFQWHPRKDNDGAPAGEPPMLNASDDTWAEDAMEGAKAAPPVEPGLGVGRPPRRPAGRGEAA